MKAWWEDVCTVWQVWWVLRRYPGMPVKVTVETPARKPKQHCVD